MEQSLYTYMLISEMPKKKLLIIFKIVYDFVEPQAANTLFLNWKISPIRIKIPTNYNWCERMKENSQESFKTQSIAHLGFMIAVRCFSSLYSFYLSFSIEKRVAE